MSGILALTIGINSYSPSLSTKLYPPLGAAIPDATRFTAFLREKIGIPSQNITVLNGPLATQQGILSAFNVLLKKQADAKGSNNIVIYFAGHGAKVKVGNEEEEVMCTFEGGAIGVRDLTRMVASSSGGVVVFMDCCHSGGILRGDDEQGDTEYIARSVRGTLVIPDLKKGPIQKVTFGGGRGDYVFLAACGKDQEAKETSKVPQGGVFTSSLLEALSEVNWKDLTYTSLAQRIRMPVWQTPHCQGTMVHRKLFSSLNVPGGDKHLIPGYFSRSNSKHVLTHGSFQGIQISSRVSIHRTNLAPTSADPNAAIAYGRISALDDFSGEIKLEKGGPFEEFYVRILDDPVATRVYSKTPIPGVTSVPSPDSADLVINPTPTGGFTFSQTDAIITSLRGSLIESLPKGARQAERVRDVITAFSNFYFHLRRNPPEAPKGIFVHIRKLDDVTLQPSGSNLLKDGEAGQVAIPIPKKSMGEDYTMTIYNQTDTPLYPSVFWFDPGQLSITQWYASPFTVGVRSRDGVDAPLPPGGELPFGYGGADSCPFTFSLSDGKKSDVGFWKIFLSTQPATTWDIAQESPFSPEGENMRGIQIDPKLHINKWTCKTIMVVQKLV